MAILGCGNMGTALLDGILSSLKQQRHSKLLSAHLRPSKFIACVNRPESVAKLERHFGEHLCTNGQMGGSIKINGCSTGEGSAEVYVWQNNNAQAVKLADIILLACQPTQAAGILADPSLRGHLSSKLLLSICVGMSATQIQEIIYGEESDDPNVGMHELGEDRENERCYIVHAMPNTASCLGESATVLSTTTSPPDSIHLSNATATRPLPPTLQALATWIFLSIGTVTNVPPSLMNAASVTGASTPAFFATVLEGVVRGAVDMGLNETEALRLAAQAMKGTAEMVLQGEDGKDTTQPSEIRDKVMTPNGCTARGVSVLQKAGVEETFAEAIKQAVERVFELGRSRR